MEADIQKLVEVLLWIQAKEVPLVLVVLHLAFRPPLNLQLRKQAVLDHRLNGKGDGCVRVDDF